MKTTRLLAFWAGIAFLLLLCVFFIRSASGTDEGAAKAEYVGSESCIGCHEEHAKSYEGSVHSRKADPRTPAGKHECESCHGPGSAHVEGGGGKGVGSMIVFSSKTTPAEEKNHACLQCHDKRQLMHFTGSVHDERGLSCASCHNPHGGNGKLLAKPTEEELCAECHKRTRTDLLKSSHHPVREGKMTCSSCHNPHGSAGPKNLKANSVNELCYKCHTEKRGPFVWEHAPVVEECNNCHAAHGSNHRKLLVQKSPYLCQSCHVIASGHVSFYALAQGQNNAYTGSGPAGGNPSSRLVGKGCMNCHTNIHGTNHPSGKYFVR